MIFRNISDNFLKEPKILGERIVTENAFQFPKHLVKKKVVELGKRKVNEEENNDAVKKRKLQ